MTDDLEVAVATLLYKTPRYTRLWNYYDGHFPLVYATEGLSDLFSDIRARFAQNWCAVVIDSVTDRIQLQRILIADDETASEQIAGLMNTSRS